MSLPLQRGKAGEMHVVAELLDRGHLPYLPVVDSAGVDIMLGNGLRLQVKASRLRVNCQDSRPAYRFTLGSGSVGSGKNRRYVRKAKQYSEECDYVIFYGVDEKRFWIVPSFLLDGRKCLVITDAQPKPRAAEAEKLRSQGLFYSQMAEEMGVCTTTAWKRINQGDFKVGGFIRGIKFCENRWEFLNSTVVPTVVDGEDLRWYRKQKEIAELELMLETKAEETR